MSLGRYVCTVSTSTFAAATARTPIQLASTTLNDLTLVSWWAEFNSTSATAKPILVELTRSTGNITGSTPSIRKYNPQALAAKAKVRSLASGEGTLTNAQILESHRIHPQAGIVIQYPLGREVVLSSTSPAYIRIRITAAAAVTGSFGFVWEE